MTHLLIDREVNGRLEGAFARMAMQTAQDLFLHELGDMYDAEQRIEQMLPNFEKESDNDQVRAALQMHLQQTRQHIQNLDQVFQILGSKPPKVTCAAIQGLKQEHDSFLKENPSPEVLTMFDVGAASKTEHYEIASYQGLIDKARLMGQQQVVQLLQQNLQQEEDMARKCHQLGQQLGKVAVQHMGQMGTLPQASSRANP
jgi:ferritin-like metal-binding protein YciE